MSVHVDHNPYLAEGEGTVDAIVTIAIDGGAVDDAAAPDRVEAIVIDCSTSMKTPHGKFDAAKRATAAAIDEMVDGTFFTVIAGTEKARPVYLADGKPLRASETSRAAAAHAVDALEPGGGTAIGSWLAHIRDVVGGFPGALTQAILLTDGKDEHETPEDLGTQIGLSEGEFACDCRGVGTDWRVDELRAISSALHGTVDIVADPADLAADLAAMMRDSMAKTIPELTLRLWTPAGARITFVKQVALAVEDLTARRVDADGQHGDYPLGAWGHEERDYHIQVQVEPADVGREKLATRVTVLASADPLGQGLVTATWTTDHLEDDRLKVLTVDDLFDVVVQHGLHFDQSRRTGVVFHRISCLTECGRVGMTAVGDTPEEAWRIYQEAEKVLLREADLALEEEARF